MPHLCFSPLGRSDPLSGGELGRSVIFKTIEESGISTWIRDSPSFFAFWFILSLHAIGMGLLVGASLVIDLRILGVARELPLGPLKGLYKVIWTGFGIQVVSGLLLLIAYPTKAFTNLDFYLKIDVRRCSAVVVMKKLNSESSPTPALSDSDMMAKGKALAVWSLVLWGGVVTCGPDAGLHVQLSEIRLQRLGGPAAL